MSRYFAFVFLALSVSSVLAAPQFGAVPFDPTTTIDIVTDAAGNAFRFVYDAGGNVIEVVPVPLPEAASDTISARAPAELPQAPSVPDTTTLTRPVLGERSNGKVYSSSTLRKRDWQYPTSTKDCLMSEVPEKSKGFSYTYDGQEYSEECLTRLALSVPSESRMPCRATGLEARGYDEKCLFKKAFDEDWKVDVEKAKEDELAWRAAHPSSSSSDAWSKLYPAAVSDCSVAPKSMGGMKKTAAKDVWNAYSILPSGDILENDCLLRLVLDANIILDLETCSAVERSPLLLDLDLDAALDLDLDAVLDLDLDAVLDLVIREPSTTEVAAPRALLDVVVGVIAALRTGCLLDLIIEIVLSLGIEAIIAGGPLGVLELVFDVLAILKL